jgi:hypothetical protein
MGKAKKHPGNEQKLDKMKVKHKMPTHISTHLQFALAETQTQNCKRVEILPTHPKDKTL